MPQVILIAAMARQNVIGRDNRLLWHLPEDMRHFKQLTQGHAVIMGRKTWDSLPEKFRPLPGRHNIVISRNSALDAPGASVVSSLEAALAACATADTAFVIGGAEIYALALPLAERMELTEIDASFEGDAFFPSWDETQWQETQREPGIAADGTRFVFVSYSRGPGFRS